jgi:ribosomal protein S12 methylthiotransferase
VLTTDGYAYLKVADGCSNHCTYCLIPAIRGKYRSVPMADLITEAKSLGCVNELILVAQDTARYGLDLEPQTSLVALIRELCKLENIKGIRLMYCYPENVTDELIHELAVNPKMIKYIDMPLQHADDGVLKLMNRKGTGQGYLDLIAKLKQRVPGITIRSTFIAGFPRESDEAFNNLTDFLQKAKLFNAGFFKYSKEDGTAAARLDGQVAGAIKTKRYKKLYSVQKKVVRENNKALIGRTFKVVAEGFDADQLVYYGRAYFNAPDIDGKIYFFSSEEVEYGKFYDIEIIKATGYDLYGERV